MDEGCHPEKVLREGLQPSVPWSTAVLICRAFPDWLLLEALAGQHLPNQMVQS